jgi:hypothetical protein
MTTKFYTLRLDDGGTLNVSEYVFEEMGSPWERVIR